MGGGLLQLITKNIQNKYLTRNPEFTYFKKAYLRYTNFSFEQFKYNFEGEKNFGNNINCIIENDGDLLSLRKLKLFSKLIISLFKLS